MDRSSVIDPAPDRIHHRFYLGRDGMDRLRRALLGSLILRNLTHLRLAKPRPGDAQVDRRRQRNGVERDLDELQRLIIVSIADLRQLLPPLWRVDGDLRQLLPPLCRDYGDLRQRLAALR